MNPWGETPPLELADASVIAETDAIVGFLDQSHPGRRITGETPLDQGLDTMWNNRIWVHILYRIVTAFHVLHQGLGPKLERTSNPARGEHCRKEALAHAGLVNQHLADGRDWILKAPDGDRFLVIGEHEPENFVFDPHFFGIERSADLIFIQVTSAVGNLQEQRRASSRQVADDLNRRAGVRREDVFISLVFVDRDDWLFRNDEPGGGTRSRALRPEPRRAPAPF